MPLDYILFILMKILKEHNRKTIISRDSLIIGIGELLTKSNLSEELKEKLFQDFDFEYEIEMALDKYAGYISDEDGMIILSPYVKLDTINNLLEESSAFYDKGLLKFIYDFYDYNISVFKVIGIKIETGLYDKGIEYEENIKACYSKLAKAELCGDKVPNSLLNDLKINILKRRFLFNQMKMGLSLQEYNDLYSYSLKNAELLGTDNYKFKIENDEFNLTMKEDPFHRVLFFDDGDKDLVFSESFYRESKYNTDEGKTKEVFYTKVIDIINSRISEYDDVDEDLIYAKYNLMYAMDVLYQDEDNYNGYLFMNDRKNYINYDEDYSFIEREIFYLIDEVFMYTDIEMSRNDGTDYENTIKSILIEAYYKVTKDERVIEAIRSHDNYGKYHFVTQLFDNIINDKKKKTRRKEDE